MGMQKGRNGLVVESDKVADDLYYLKDILTVGEPCLSRLVTENLLNGLVFPIIISLLASKENNVRSIGFKITFHYLLPSSVLYHSYLCLRLLLSSIGFKFSERCGLLMYSMVNEKFKIKQL